ncbi:MAG: hypothetical protein WBC22_08955 [Sedimentisphaerales bacterium]
MRTAFINELIALAGKNPRLFLIVGDLGFSVVEPFAEKYPDRFLNAGIAEQNMAGVAAGIASEGYHVLIYSIANFPTFRCAEQLRNDIAYHELPVTVVAVGGGLAYGNLGYSHHAVQDYAIIRTMPNMTLAAPGDPVETACCLDWLVDNPCPSYLRLGKAGEAVVHSQRPDVKPGVPVILKESIESGLLVLTTGAALTYGAAFVKETEFSGWGLASVPIWGEPFRCILAESLSCYRKIIVIEDHLCAGGFGSFVGETLIMKGAHHVAIRYLALDSYVCGQVMMQQALNSIGGITHDRFRQLQLSF